MHLDSVILLKIIGVAFAVGLDVLAISIGVGITPMEPGSSIRLGLAFSAAEVTMQVIGYELGTGAGKMFGEIADYVGLALLAVVGVFMIRESFRHADAQRAFDPTRGGGLLLASLSISLDSLGVGFALPGVGIPLVPLLITLSITTVVVTLVGLRFGARIGERFERRAEQMAGGMLIILALLFTIEHVVTSG